MKTTDLSIQNMAHQLEKTTRKINASIDFDVHWYRRVFHAFAASFLFYYLLPDEQWMIPIKYMILSGVLVFVVLLEYLRIKGVLDSKTFFGLRVYEQHRPGSYLYFGVAVLLLLIFFPQQIAIPCILCGSLGDPILGELRYRFGKFKAACLGFFFCMLFFSVSWYTADTYVMISVAIVGAFCAVAAESKKYTMLDDDFMIQMVPAVIILLLWLGIKNMGFDILPSVILHPLI
ncbi:MAG: dolichol kinase [Euryarchaeota archaeon]|nr:dolichol kinase [Euryarchaeota archaeon]